MEYNLEYGGVVVNLDKYQAKFPGKTPGWTDWGQFIAEASTLSEFDAAGKPMANGLDIAADWPEPAKHLFLSQILQRGGSYWSSTGGHVRLQHPGGARLAGRDGEVGAASTRSCSRS